MIKKRLDSKLKTLLNLIREIKILNSIIKTILYLIKKKNKNCGKTLALKV